MTAAAAMQRETVALIVETVL
ncbi:MAG: hypothetical protein QOG74_1134, partial [Alphaproteobacteria bacterium]|nr:hypothetical protein [Alphaproteobacteria bacterium]